MINYGKESRLLNIKYSIIEFYKKNKIIIFVIGVLLIIALLTGIFTSIKMYNLDKDIDLKKYSIYALLDGSVYSFKYFFFVTKYGQKINDQIKKSFWDQNPVHRTIPDDIQRPRAGPQSRS